jgi:hypothetical protein
MFNHLAGKYAFAIDQDQISQVDKHTKGLAYHEDRLLAMECVDKQSHAAQQAQVPEHHRDDALACVFAAKPLHDESTGE